MPYWSTLYILGEKIVTKENIWMFLKQLLKFLLDITKQKVNQFDGINAVTTDADQL